MGDFLWDLIPWGYRILLEIETWRNPFLDSFFSVVTELGSEYAYIVFFTLLYLCYNKRVGIGVAYATLFSSTLNSWAKHLYEIPRPDSPLLEEILTKAGISERLDPLWHETSPSWPSGHTQGTMVMWTYLATRVKKAWVWVVAVAIFLLVAFSRMYGGVHFPQDLLGGWAIGAILLGVWLSTESSIVSILSGFTRQIQYTLAICIPLLILVLVRTDDAVSSMGALSGATIAYILEAQRVRFNPAGPWWKRVLRGVLGLVIVFATYFVLSVLFGLFDESLGELLAMLVRAFRYALVGFIGFYPVPALFVRLGLAERES